MSENQNDESSTVSKLSFFYANSIAVSTSGYDVSVLFSREIPGGENPIRIENLMVHMSPMLVKRFNQILTTVIERYEQTVGVIPVPPEKIPMEGNQDETSKDSE